MGIRVVIADGFQILLEGLAAILTSRGGCCWDDENRGGGGSCGAAT